MLQFIDSLLDRITMYRLLLYYLIALVVIAAAENQLGYLHFDLGYFLFSACFLVAVCWLSNRVFAYVFEAPTNRESSLITALILLLIITPISTSIGFIFLAAAGGLATASKYLLAIGKKHIFNPAAVAVVLTGVGATQTASWWIGNSSMLPFVAIGGILLARKVRRMQMVISFIVAAYLATILYTALGHGQIMSTLHSTTFSSSLFFLAFVMLTEPLTSPAQLRQQRWYAVLVGVLFPPQVHLFSLYGTPEIALVIGNAFSQLVNPKVKVFPRLVRKEQLSPTTADFILEAENRFNYQPGQYMEFTLPHTHADSRGDRRYFTLASSPTEPTLRLGVRFYPKGSSYKKALLSMNNDTAMVAAQLGGDFVLPRDRTRKLAFIAGGIGITPYRSMVKYLLDKHEPRDVAMLYGAGTPSEFVYTDTFEQARRQFSMATTYFATNPGPQAAEPHHRTGQITSEAIRQAVPDYRERLFYVSGPHAMVTAVKHNLRQLGVPSRQIKIDFFPGY